MEALRHCLFLADFHLHGKNDMEVFVNFLKKQRQCDAVFFLGDIFEFFAYDLKAAISYYKEVVDSIKKLSGKTRVVYVEGNHDFCLGNNFSRGEIEVYKDSLTLNLMGNSVVLAHGDGFTGERKYGIMRTILRSTPLRITAKVLPESLLFHFGLFMASIGSKKKDRESRTLLRRMQKFVAKIIENGADIVITGHYHFPFIKRVRGNQKNGVWICVGGPHYYCEYRDEVFYIKDYPFSKRVFEVFNLPHISLKSISL